MNILSLFDWMSCWQIAINKLWITDYTYFASEIDKYRMQVTKHNFPNTIHIWDVTQVKWEDYKAITLLLWWSPCQWFSFAWKQLNFEDIRSKLFFEYVRILKEVKPRYFLLENVKMKKEYQDIISEYLFWIQPIEINSSLVSAQNRKRLYWIWELQEDWTYKRVIVEQPKDKWILLKDILEDKVEEKYYLSNETFEKLKRFESNSRLSPLDWKSYWLNTMQWWHRQPKIFEENKLKIRKLTPLECERLQIVPDNYTSYVSNSQRYKMLWNGWTVDIIVYILSQLNLN
jgi:DNA-cytosine methyltransferase